MIVEKLCVMPVNWLIIAVAALVLLSLLLFLAISNRRDRQKFTDQLNKDYFRQNDRHKDDENPDDLKGS